MLIWQLANNGFDIQERTGTIKSVTNYFKEINSDSFDQLNKVYSDNI